MFFDNSKIPHIALLALLRTVFEAYSVAEISNNDILKHASCLHHTIPGIRTTRLEHGSTNSSAIFASSCREVVN